jgi:hypothetical protein
MDQRGRISARILAPAALAVCAVLFLFVLISSTGGGGEDKGDRAGGAQTESNQPSRRRRRPSGGRSSGSTYTVKAGDTLGSIAQKTGLTVEQLQERNPQLDPQALVAGQKLRLRE